MNANKNLFNPAHLKAFSEQLWRMIDEKAVRLPVQTVRLLELLDLDLDALAYHLSKRHQSEVFVIEACAARVCEDACRLRKDGNADITALLDHYVIDQKGVHYGIE